MGKRKFLAVFCEDNKETYRYIIEAVDAREAMKEALMGTIGEIAFRRPLTEEGAYALIDEDDPTCDVSADLGYLGGKKDDRGWTWGGVFDWVADKDSFSKEEVCQGFNGNSGNFMVVEVKALTRQIAWLTTSDDFVEKTMEKIRAHAKEIGVVD